MDCRAEDDIYPKDMSQRTLVLGAGITGLSAGIAAGLEVYEASKMPGGICASYYVSPRGDKSFHRETDESYRFELGGGHWIFGVDNKVSDFINSLSQAKKYERQSSVYLPGIDIHVPYPIQNHLSYLPSDIKEEALKEMLAGRVRPIRTLADWLEMNFGKTLCGLFFFPFHELYTAGLYTRIAPQDAFKTPINIELIIKGAQDKTPSVGYNATFVYPENGLDDLIRKMSDRCRINYYSKVARIDAGKKEVVFSDGKRRKFDKVISTLPLNRMVDMAGMDIGKADPYTSVLVINIGAKSGKRCPREQWVYVPRSRTGFHRVGFYSNVDVSFLPVSSRFDGSRVSIYVEKAYEGGKKPSDAEIQKTCDDTVRELKEWQFISEEEVVDPTWIDIAYTWQYPNSSWRGRALETLKRHDIYQAGRYGKWKFQGISESIRDGLEYA
jgi:protoporphyrinogen oxidase